MNLPKRHRPNRHNKHKAVFIGVEDAHGGVGTLFIEYLKQRFRIKAEVSVKHHPCKGGSYANMFRVAQRASRNDSFDKKLMIWDADRSTERRDTIPSADELGQFESVLMSPCVEGVLLELLGKKVPKGSHKCKAILRAESPFTCIGKFHQKFKNTPDKTFRKHPAVSRILLAMTATVSSEH